MRPRTAPTNGCPVAEAAARANFTSETCHRAKVSTAVVGDFKVAEYRVYVVGDDGHFIDVEPLVCAGDTEAIERAKRLLKGPCDRTLEWRAYCDPAATR